MTIFSYFCTAASPQTCKLAIERHSQKHPYTPPLDPDALATRIMQCAIPHLPGSKQGIEESDPYAAFIQKSVVSLPHPNGGVSIALKGSRLQDGLDKTVYSGWLATADKIHAVAVILTKNKPLVKKNRNGRELEILTQLTQKENPGCVKVWAVHPISSLPTQQSQFLALQDLYHSDLFPFVWDPFLANQIPRRYIEEIQNKIVSAVGELRSGNGLSHRDLKPENILITVTRNGEPHFDLPLKELLAEECPDIEIYIRLCDFASATPYDEKLTFSHEGTPAYTSPEAAKIIGKKSFQIKPKPAEQTDPFLIPEKMDIWSLGLILLILENFDLFHTVVPFQKAFDAANGKISAKEIEEARKKVFIETYQEYYSQRNIPVFPEPEKTNIKLHMIWEMLQPRPERRPSIEEVKKVFCKSIPSEKKDNAIESSSDLIPSVKEPIK